MRDAFVQAMTTLAAKPDVVFLTGDVGFGALEPLRDAIGERFINCGVAEQNMIGVAAGLAKQGLDVFVYSIAPFCYARPFEQIRNDLALSGLPVSLVGNGGGYAYGVMGPTHHALEDYGILSTLPGLRSYIPATDIDVGAAVKTISARTLPCYLRLGRDEMPKGVTLPPFAAWRLALDGDGPVVVVCGPIAGATIAALDGKDAQVWVVSELPVLHDDLPIEMVERLNAGAALLIVEEHVSQGGLGMMLAHALMLAGVSVRRSTHLHAKGYMSGRYGSQLFHRRESGIDGASVARAFYALAAS